MGVTPRRGTVWLSPDPPLTLPSVEPFPSLAGRGVSHEWELGTPPGELVPVSPTNAPSHATINA